MLIASQYATFSNILLTTLQSSPNFAKIFREYKEINKLLFPKKPDFRGTRNSSFLSFSINISSETWWRPVSGNGEPRKYLSANNRGCVRINNVLHGWMLLKAQDQREETILILKQRDMTYIPENVQSVDISLIVAKALDACLCILHK